MEQQETVQVSRHALKRYLPTTTPLLNIVLCIYSCNLSILDWGTSGLLEAPGEVCEKFVHFTVESVSDLKNASAVRIHFLLAEEADEEDVSDVGFEELFKMRSRKGDIHERSGCFDFWIRYDDEYECRGGEFVYECVEVRVVYFDGVDGTCGGSCACHFEHLDHVGHFFEAMRVFKFESRTSTERGVSDIE